MLAVDYICNAPYGIDVPFHFIREEQWDGLFQAARLACCRLRDSASTASIPSLHILFKLECLGHPVSAA